jgi:hypothetical protein
LADLLWETCVMSTKTKWKIYICAIEHTYEQASEDKARVLEISAPLELQPANSCSR